MAVGANLPTRTPMRAFRHKSSRFGLEGRHVSIGLKATVGQQRDSSTTGHGQHTHVAKHQLRNVHKAVIKVCADIKDLPVQHQFSATCPQCSVRLLRLGRGRPEARQERE